MTRVEDIPVTICVLASALCATAFGAEDPKTAERAGAISIAQIKREAPIDFEKEILPIFKKNCLACHNKTKAKGDLILETPQTILKGAESGAVVVPGKSAESLLLKVAAHQVEDTVMPPRDNKVAASDLTPEELGLLKLWIDQGAKGEVHGPLPVIWQPLPEGLNPIFAVALTPDGHYAACSRANQIFIYHLPSGQLVERLTDPQLLKSGVYSKPGAAHLDLVHSLAFSPDGNLLASGGYREVKLWRRQKSRPRFDLVLDKTVRSIAVSPDKKWLATGTEEGTIQLRELPTGREAKTLRGHEKAITSLKFSPTGTKLCSGSLDKSFRVWSVPDGAIARTVVTPAEINAVIWSAGDKQIATAHEDQLIRIWQWSTADAATPDKELKGHEGAVTSLDTLPSSENRLLSGSADGTVRVWDIDKGEQVREMKHGGPVTAVAARSDGKRFASAGLNRAAKLWDPEKGESVAELKGDRYAQEHAEAMERAAKFATSEVAYRKTSLQSAEGEQKKLTERLARVTETNAVAEKAIVEKKKNLETASESKTKAGQALADLKTEVKKITDAYEAADKEAKFVAADANATLEKAFLAERIAQKDSDADKTGDDLTKAKTTADQPFSDLKAQLKKLSAALEAAEKEAKRASSEAKTAIEKAKSQERAEESSKDDKQTADHSARERALTDEKSTIEKIVESVAGKSFAAGQAKAALDKVTAESPEKIKQATDKLTTASNALATAEREFKRAEVVKANTAHELELTTNSLNQATSALAKAKDALEAAETEKKNSEIDLEFAKQSASRVEKPIRAIAFSADNRTLATAGDDQRVHTWSAETGAAFDTYRRHTDGVFAIAFAGAESLISAAEDQSVISWDLTTDWALERVIGTGDINSPLVDRVNAVRFSPDGKLLATGGGEPSRGGEIKLWRVSDGSPAQDFPNVHSDAVFGLDFSADGKYLASGAADRFVKVIELATGKTAKSFEGHTHHVLGVSWKQDGRTLASCGADNAIKVWDFVTGERKKTPTGGPLENFGKEVTAIAFISGTDQAVVCSGDSQVRKVRDNGEQVRAFEGAADYVHSSAVTPDGKIVIAGGQDSVLRVWDGSNSKAVATFAPPSP